jgi:arginyl-tRNA synthetase
MAHLEALVAARLAPAYAVVAGRAVDPAVRRSARADFQSDAALGLAKELGMPPFQIATQVVAASDFDGLAADVEVSGPGFINITLDTGVLGRLLDSVAASERLSIPRATTPQTVLVDYSAPNVAKEMHVGHLRSTIIGDAAVRLFEWLGHDVIRQNHIGDWGTPFGMLIEHMLDLGEAEAVAELSIGDLNSFYKAARVSFDASEEFQQRARARVVALQSGDEATLRLWRILVEQYEKYFMSVYDALGVRLEPGDFAGESSYNDQLADVLAELTSLGLIQKSEGADCLFPPGFTGRDGTPLPLIVRKSDGGYGYASTDLATIRHRTRDLAAQRILYVVGAPQHQHFAMIFAAAREAKWLTDPVSAEHIGFGSVLGRDGKMLSSRAGTSVKLSDLLTEAVARAEATIAEKNPSLSPTERTEVARAVGIGAVKYADLSTDRVKDYTFDYDRMLAFDGDTAPYLQYARTRALSVLRKAAGEGAESPDELATVLSLPAPMLLVEEAERELALTLLAFEPTLQQVSATLEFHRLTGYLYAVATAFTAFYERCPILRSEGQLLASRLTLTLTTARTLATGLSLLGIEAPARM